jgi:hypothetical protein
MYNTREVVYYLISKHGQVCWKTNYGERFGIKWQTPFESRVLYCTTHRQIGILRRSIPLFQTIACILKAHSHSRSKSGGSIWASLECQCCFWIVGGLVSYLTMRLLTLQLFKNSIDTQGKLRLNLHSLSVGVSGLFRIQAYMYVSLTELFCVSLNF